MILSVGLIVVALKMFFRKAQPIPGLSQSIGELPFVLVTQMIDDTNDQKAYPFISLILSIFLFVFIGNFMGLFPLSFTFTSQLIVNFALALLVLCIITIIGFIKHGVGFLKLFFPDGIPLWVAPILVPIELISYLARPVSLAIRLFANMVAGHSILKIFAYYTGAIGVFGIFPLIVNMGFIAFELLVAFLQAYVFAILCCIYLHDALELH
jgi:F-type H+-transporting ATPase subunit a